MTLPAAIRTVRWMVWDTGRQAVATKLFWVILAFVGVCTAVCLSVDVSGDEAPQRLDYEVPAVMRRDQVVRLGLEELKKQGTIAEIPDDPNNLPAPTLQKAWEIGKEKCRVDGVRIVSGEVSLGFGAIKVDLARNREDAVKYIQVMLAGYVGDALGVLIALVWTAGFAPSFLDPQQATVLLAKPTRRWLLLLGKYLGVVLFVAGIAAMFVGLTWLSLGIKTGIWTGAYWLAVPLLAVNFAVFYSVSLFLAVWTRNPAVCTFGTVLFWFLCWGMNFAHHGALANPPPNAGAGGLFLMDVGYWLLPKPLDLSGIFFDAIEAEGFAGKVPELANVQKAGQFHGELSVLASLAFATVTVGLAAYELEMTDY